MTYADDIIRILEAAKDAIQQNMATEGINATGNTSASFRVERYDGGVRLVMGGTEEKTAPLATLEVGRPGGPVPKGFTQILYEWSIAKGIPFDKDSRRRSFAYLLGRRIRREGTLRHMQPVDVYTTIVLDVADRVKADAVKSITTAIHQQLRQ